MLHGAGGTRGFPPSPCLHPVVDTFLFYANLSFSYAVHLFFLCSMAQLGRGVSLHLHVAILLSTRCFMLICPFLMLSPSSSYAPRRGWDGGEGLSFTRPDLFWCYPLCGAGFFLCCACPFLMLHGALSIHLHVSPSISMSPILLSTCLFSDCEPYLVLCCSCPSCAPWAKGGGRGGLGAH